MADETHDRAGYRRGCRCDVCREANRVYQREYRTRKGKVASVTALPIPESPIDSVVVAVQIEIDQLGVREDRPAQVAMALALARIIDNPGALPQHATAIGKLTTVLEKLSRGAPRPDSTLARLRNQHNSSRP